MLVTRVRGLEGIGAGANLQNEVHDVLELQIVHARSHIDAVAGVMPHFFRRNVAQRMVERLDAQLRTFPKLLEREIGLLDPVGDEMRIVDLQQKAGLYNRLVFLAQRVGDGE